MSKIVYPNYEYERTHHVQQTLVIGIDEVGRGPLAGPVVVAGVVFSAHHQLITGITDSKLIKKVNYLTLAEAIKSQAIAYSIVEGSVDQINEQGINYALVSAMNQVITELSAKIKSVREICIVVDGRPPRNPPFITSQRQDWIIKGDQKIYSIAAASIIAKVHRDAIMKQLSREYPSYGWEHNMGYGTVSHREAIKIHGVTHHHRTLFIRKLLQNTTE